MNHPQHARPAQYGQTWHPNGYFESQGCADRVKAD